VNPRLLILFLTFSGSFIYITPVTKKPPTTIAKTPSIKYSIIFFDFFSTNISRIIKKKSFFNAGVDHLHFFLKQKIGLTKTLFLMNLINIFLGLYGYTIWYFFGNLISIINFIIFSIIYLFVLNKINFNKITQNI
jgi:hypothetical protein